MFATDKLVAKNSKCGCELVETRHGELARSPICALGVAWKRSNKLEDYDLHCAQITPPPCPRCQQPTLYTTYAWENRRTVQVCIECYNALRYPNEAC